MLRFCPGERDKWAGHVAKGARLPSWQKRLADGNAVWRKIIVPHWYSTGPRTIQVATGTAVWYRVGLPVVPIRWILIRDPQQQFRSQALLSTDLKVVPGQAIQWFVWRGQLETTFAEVRSKLGVESQRQWSDLAIARTTPCLLALFSVVTLLAADLHWRGKLEIRQSAWYTIAAVRKQIWSSSLFAWSPETQDYKESPDIFSTT